MVVVFVFWLQYILVLLFVFWLQYILVLCRGARGSCIDKPNATHSVNVVMFFWYLKRYIYIYNGGLFVKI